MTYFAVIRYYVDDDDFHIVCFDTLEAARECKKREEAEDEFVSVTIFEAKPVY